jgi:hypothetical protein
MENTQHKPHLAKYNTESMQMVTVPQSPVENPSAWMQYGTSPTEIILAVAVVIVATSSVIGSIACVLHVLQPSRKAK